jgi:hypothetical protein
MNLIARMLYLNFNVAARHLHEERILSSQLQDDCFLFSGKGQLCSREIAIQHFDHFVAAERT